MSGIRIRKRRRLRNREVKQIAESFESIFGNPFIVDGDAVDMADSSDYDLLFINGSILGLLIEGEPFLSVRGALHYRPEKRYVTVDMGAVPFVTNGADIMTPGIVEADPEIAEGDMVFIRDIRNKVPLAVGRSLMSGEELVASQSGKGVLSIQHFGDRLWKHEEN